jgi:hypothetical protein
LCYGEASLIASRLKVRIRGVRDYGDTHAQLLRLCSLGLVTRCLRAATKTAEQVYFPLGPYIGVIESLVTVVPRQIAADRADRTVQGLAQGGDGTYRLAGR